MINLSKLLQHHIFFFIFLLIQVLITKLRSANTVETRQYRKASKALLVLIPLLGITYLVVLAGPNEGVGSYIFVVARAFLLSTQVNIQSINCSRFYCIYVCATIFDSHFPLSFFHYVFFSMSFYFVLLLSCFSHLFPSFPGFPIHCEYA